MLVSSHHLAHKLVSWNVLYLLASSELAATVRSIQYTATWYLPAWVLALKGGSGMGSRVILTQMSESEVYIRHMKCM